MAAIVLDILLSMTSWFEQVLAAAIKIRSDWEWIKPCMAKWMTYRMNLNEKMTIITFLILSYSELSTSTLVLFFLNLISKMKTQYLTRVMSCFWNWSISSHLSHRGSIFVPHTNFFWISREQMMYHLIFKIFSQIISANWNRLFSSVHQHLMFIKIIAYVNMLIWNILSYLSYVVF